MPESPPALALQARERQAELLESISRLAGGIAHDFNNLLTAILGYSELLDSQLQKRGDMTSERSDLGEIRAAAERAREFTDRLLALSRRVPNTPRVVDVHSTLTEVERLARRIANARIEVTLAASKSAGSVLVDSARLEQVLLSLVVNAIDAMPAGGQLQLATRRVHVGTDELPGVLIGDVILTPGDYAEIAVTDSGAGMSPEFVFHAFLPFVTTKERASSSGLGLPMVFGLVTQARGAVFVESAIGSGTTVRVLLPQATNLEGESQ